MTNEQDGDLYLDYYLGKVLRVLAWIGGVTFCLFCLAAYWSVR